MALKRGLIPNFSFRKVCLNCRCGKAEHNVIDDQDPGFYFVGKIFDRPLRSKAEEMEFCYGENDSDSVSSEEERLQHLRKSSLATKKIPGSGVKKKTVRFEWVPPNTSKTLVRALQDFLSAWSDN